MNSFKVGIYPKIGGSESGVFSRTEVLKHRVPNDLTRHC